MKDDLKKDGRGLKKIVNNNTLGKIMYAEGHFSHDKLANLTLDAFIAAEIAPAAVSALGVHLTDLMIWLFGPVKTVFATTSHRVLKYKTGDVVTASLIHESGLTSQITAILKTPHYQRVTIWGENGWVELVDSSHPDTPGPSFLKVVMNDGSEYNVALDSNEKVTLFYDAENMLKKDDYLFSDLEKYLDKSLDSKDKFLKNKQYQLILIKSKLLYRLFVRQKSRRHSNVNGALILTILNRLYLDSHYSVI